MAQQRPHTHLLALDVQQASVEHKLPPLRALVQTTVVDLHGGGRQDELLQLLLAVNSPGVGVL